MRRGTTPVLTISVNTDLTGANEIWLTIRDSAGTEVTIEREGMTVTATAITCTLTQEQTLSLAPGNGTVQLRALTGGVATASGIISCDIRAILKEGVIGA